jgi:LmbE family N-acetylglucosaminyl deacetylase
MKPIYHSVPIVLPHYKRRQDGVFFLISRRETVTLSGHREAAWFDAIDGEATVADLEYRWPGILSSIEEWARRGIVKFLPPEKESPGGTHALVIEPHMDDAILSVGGCLIRRSWCQQTTILSVVRWSSYTSYLLSGRTEFSDVSAVSQLRAAESEIAARLCGAKFLSMNESDAIVEMGMPLRPDALPRLHWNLHAWGSFGPTEDEVAALSERIFDVVRSIKPDELWIPMGLGPHFDHVRTRQACLHFVVAAQSELGKMRIILYKDLPYASQFPQQADFVLRALASAGATLVRRAEDIADVFEHKVDALSAYASQWKESKVRDAILDDAQCADRMPGLQETYYEMTKVPGHLPRVSEMSFDRRLRASFVARFRPWLDGIGASERLSVFVSVPPVRWERVIQMFSECFPGKRVCVFCLPECGPPMGFLIPPRVTLSEVSTVRDLDDIQASCESAEEWTLVLGADSRRQRGAHSERCLIAPTAGLLYTLWREERAAVRSSD